MRGELMANAKGTVLEVAAGTGRNMDYYPMGNGPNAVNHVVATDISQPMLRVAAEKAKKANKEKRYSFENVAVEELSQKLEVTRNLLLLVLSSHGPVRLTGG